MKKILTTLSLLVFTFSANLLKANPDPILAFDVETGGPNLGRHPLLSIGCSLQNPGSEDPESKEIMSFYVNIQCPENREWDEGTLKFFKGNADAYAALQEDQKSPKEAMRLFVDFLKEAWSYNPTLVSDNPGFDVAGSTPI